MALMYSVPLSCSVEPPSGGVVLTYAGGLRYGGVVLRFAGRLHDALVKYFGEPLVDSHRLQSLHKAT